MTVDDVAHLDLCYAPPYSSAMDNIITASDIARNKLDGKFLSLTPMAVKEKIDRGALNQISMTISCARSCNRRKIPTWN